MATLELTQAGALGALATTFHEHSQREFVDPTAIQLAALAEAFDGLEFLATPPIQRIEVKSPTLKISASYLCVDDESHVRITAHPIDCPDHIKLALDDFPCELVGPDGTVCRPERRQEGSLYFNDIAPNQIYQFRISPSNS